MASEWDKIQLGSKIGANFKILRKLEPGGGGPVFSGIDMRSKDVIHIRFFSGTAFSDEAFFNQRMEEAREARDLCGEIIILPVEWGFQEGVPYTAYKAGSIKTLEQALQTGRRFEEKDAKSVAEPLLKMLVAAHEAGLCHLGLSPFSVCRREGGLFAMEPGVLDFSLTPRKGHGYYTFPASVDKKFVSVAAYMSPEQAAESDSVDFRSDLYSLGCLVYRIIVGKPPFEGSSAEVIIGKVAKEKPRALAEDSSGISEGTREFLSRALQKDPEERFQSASEMMESFYGSLGGTAAKKPGVPSLKEKVERMKEKEPAAAPVIRPSPTIKAVAAGKVEEREEPEPPREKETQEHEPEKPKAITKPPPAMIVPKKPKSIADIFKKVPPAPPVPPVPPAREAEQEEGRDVEFEIEEEKQEAAVEEQIQEPAETAARESEPVEIEEIPEKIKVSWTAEVRKPLPAKGPEPRREKAASAPEEKKPAEEAARPKPPPVEKPSGIPPAPPAKKKPEAEEAVLPSVAFDQEEEKVEEKRGGRKGLWITLVVLLLAAAGASSYYFMFRGKIPWLDKIFQATAGLSTPGLKGPETGAAPEKAPTAGTEAAAVLPAPADAEEGKEPEEMEEEVEAGTGAAETEAKAEEGKEGEKAEAVGETAAQPEGAEPAVEKKVEKEKEAEKKEKQAAPATKKKKKKKKKGPSGGVYLE